MQHIATVCNHIEPKARNAKPRKLHFRVRFVLDSTLYRSIRVRQPFVCLVRNPINSIGALCNRTVDCLYRKHYLNLNCWEYMYRAGLGREMGGGRVRWAAPSFAYLKLDMKKEEIRNRREC